MDPIHIFLSSPSDVGYERARAERVAQRLSGEYDGLDIQTYRWEAGQYFSAHEGFQEQIPDVGRFDLVVGVLWSRVGAPLPPDFPKMADGRPYASGTAFEILRAIDHRRQPGNALPDVFVYRKMAGPPPAPPDDILAQEARLADLKQLNEFVREWFADEENGFKGAFFPFRAADEFEALFEQHLRAWIAQNRRIGPNRSWRISEKGSPFPGLRSFGPERAGVFFGRRGEVERARERLADAQARGNGLLLIEGASGAGKSSLAFGGLLPRLQVLKPDWRIATLRPTLQKPVIGLARALFAPDALPELADGDFPAPEALAICLQDGHAAPVLRALDRAGGRVNARDGRDYIPDLCLVIVIDQFESILSEAIPQDDRIAFVRTIATLATSGRVQVIAPLRSDALSGILELPGMQPLIDTAARLSLASLNVVALAEAVRKPAAAAGISFDIDADGTGLDERLIADAAGRGTLPFLQFALQRLYQAALARDGLNINTDEDAPVLTLRHTDYEAFGGLAGAIADAGDNALQTLPPQVHAAFPRLIRTIVGGTPARPELLVVSAEHFAGQPDMSTLVETLVTARILVRDGDTVQLAHQRVLDSWPRARDALADAARFLRVRTDLERGLSRWTADPRDDLLISPGLQLAEAEDVLSRHGKELSARIAEYINQSGRRARRRQQVTFAAAVVLAATTLLSGVFFISARQAEQIAQSEAERADLNAAKAETQRLLAEDRAEQADSAMREALQIVDKVSRLITQAAYDQEIGRTASVDIITNTADAVSELVQRFDSVQLQNTIAMSIFEHHAAFLWNAREHQLATEVWDRLVDLRRDALARADHHPLVASGYAATLIKAANHHAVTTGPTAQIERLTEAVTVLKRTLDDPRVFGPEPDVDIETDGQNLSVSSLDGFRAILRINFALFSTMLLDAKADAGQSLEPKIVSEALNTLDAAERDTPDEDYVKQRGPGLRDKLNSY